MLRQYNCTCINSAPVLVTPCVLQHLNDRQLLKATFSKERHFTLLSNGYCLSHAVVINGCRLKVPFKVSNKSGAELGEHLQPHTLRHAKCP